MEDEDPPARMPQVGSSALLFLGHTDKEAGRPSLPLRESGRSAATGSEVLTARPYPK